MAPGSFVLELWRTAKSVIRIVRKSRLGSDLSGVLPDAGECIVLGTGPSLKADLLRNTRFFQERPCLCVNTFPLTDWFTVLKPRYYTFADPMFWEEDTSPALKETREKVFDVLRRADWEITPVLPMQARRAFTLCGTGAETRLRPLFLNLTMVDGVPWFKRLCFRRNLGMPNATNSLIPALYATLNLGFKRIYLFGADHSWHENLVLTRDNRLCFHDKHFYDAADASTLTPIYGDQQETWTVKVHEWFGIASRNFKVYFELRGYADSLGATILNASPKSFIDAFGRFEIPSPPETT